MKYFAIFDKNVETIFQLQWKIGNISDMFLQYSVLCGQFIALKKALNVCYVKTERVQSDLAWKII